MYVPQRSTEDGGQRGPFGRCVPRTGLVEQGQVSLRAWATVASPSGKGHGFESRMSLGPRECGAQGPHPRTVPLCQLFFEGWVVHKGALRRDAVLASAKKQCQGRP